MKKTALHVSIGLGLAILTIVVHSFLSAEHGLELGSFLLVLIGSVYFGFAVLSHSHKVMTLETTVASLFVLQGVFGLWVSPWFLIVGLFLHGVWDLLHHNSNGKVFAQIPQWYMPFCAAYDWSMAGYFLYLIA